MLRRLIRFAVPGGPSSSQAVEEAEDVEKGIGINQLPPEILQKILAMLPFKDTYGSCRRVCRDWNVIVLYNLFLEIYPLETRKSSISLEALSQEPIYRSPFRESSEIGGQHREYPLTSLVIDRESETPIPIKVFETYINNENPLLINVQLNCKSGSPTLSELSGYTLSAIKQHRVIHLHLKGTPLKLHESFLFTFFAHGEHLRSVHIEDTHLLSETSSRYLLKNHKMMEKLTLIGTPNNRQISDRLLYDIANFGHKLTKINLTFRNVCFTQDAINHLFTNIRNLSSFTFITGSRVSSSLKSTLKSHSPNLITLYVKYIKDKR